MPPEFVILAAVALWTVVGSYRRLPRYVHWRGPQEGTLDGVQREHLRLFHDTIFEQEEEISHG